MGRKQKNQLAASAVSSGCSPPVPTELLSGTKLLGTLREIDEDVTEDSSGDRNVAAGLRSHDIGLPSFTELRSSSEQRTVLARLENLHRAVLDLTPSGAKRERERLVCVVNELESRVISAQNAFRASVDKTIGLYETHKGSLIRKSAELEKSLHDEQALGYLLLKNLQAVRESLQRLDLPDSHVLQGLLILCESQKSSMADLREEVLELKQSLSTLASRVIALEGSLEQGPNSGHVVAFEQPPTQISETVFLSRQAALTRRAADLVRNDSARLWECEMHELARVRPTSLSSSRAASADSLRSGDNHARQQPPNVYKVLQPFVNMYRLSGCVCCSSGAQCVFSHT